MESVSYVVSDITARDRLAAFGHNIGRKSDASALFVEFTCQSARKEFILRASPGILLGTCHINAVRMVCYYFRHFDPTHAREEEIFTKLGYIDIQFLAPRIRAKVLMGTGLMDTTCPPSTQFAAFNKITSEKQVLVYPDYGHESLKGHDDIIFRFMAQL